MNDICTYKIVFIGDSGTGKTSIIQKYLFNNTDYIGPSIAANFFKKTFKCNETEFEYEIWDTSGNPKFKKLYHLYLRNADIIFLVFDVNQKYSLSVMTDYLKMVNIKNSEVILVANKCDNDKYIDTSNFENFSNINNIMFMKTSVIDDLNIDNLFDNIPILMPKKNKSKINKVKVLKTKISKNSCCC